MEGLGCEVWDGKEGDKRQGRAILDYVTCTSFVLKKTPK